MADEEITVVYDTELRRPGCVLLQAVFGGTISNQDLDAMGHWLLYPTPDMRCYSVKPEQVAALIKVTRDHNDGREGG